MLRAAELPSGLRRIPSAARAHDHLAQQVISARGDGGSQSVSSRYDSVPALALPVVELESSNRSNDDKNGRHYQGDSV